MVAEGFIIFIVSAGEQHEREGAAHAIVQRQQAYNSATFTSTAAWHTIEVNSHFHWISENENRLLQEEGRDFISSSR